MDLPVNMLSALHGRPRMRHVLSRSYAQGQIHLSLIGTEKHSSDREDPSRPNAGGSHDVEGRTWGDVAVRHRMRWWSWNDWKIYLRGILYCLKRWKWGYRPDWKFPRYEFLTFFTVNSFVVAKNDIAEERSFGVAGDYPDGDQSCFGRPGNSTPEQRAWLDRVCSAHDSILPTLTVNDVREHLSSKKFIEVADGMWVGTEDPGDIYVDESVVAFDTKDGWSDVVIGQIIVSAMYERFGLLLPFRIVPYSDQEAE